MLADLGDKGFGSRQLLTHDGRWEEAYQAFVGEADRAHRGGNQQNWSNARKDQAELALLLGQTDKAISIYEELVRVVSESITQVGHAAALVEVLALNGRTDEAKSIVSRFEEYFAAAPQGSMGAQALRARATVSMVEGATESAHHDFSVALQLMTPMGYRTEARTLSVWGASMIVASHRDEGTRLFEQAAAVYRRVGAHPRFLEPLERDREQTILVAGQG